MSTQAGTLTKLAGGQALIDWFGTVPRFHDAELMDISLGTRRAGKLQIHAWRLTDAVDVRGYFVTDRHAVITVTVEDVTRIDLYEFDLAGIIFELDIAEEGDAYRVDWSGSYGVAGTIIARSVAFELETGRPARDP